MMGKQGYCYELVTKIYIFCKAHWFIYSGRNHIDLQNGSLDVHYISLVAFLLEVPMVLMARLTFSGTESMLETHPVLV